VIFDYYGLSIVNKACQTPPVLIYIHWPFCLAKCHYCDFNSQACDVKSIDYDFYMGLYLKTLGAFFRIYYQGQSVRSIYFGGGTPSLLSWFFIASIVSYIENNFNVDKDVEITVEANPKTIDKEKGIMFKKAGINRISIGLQSLRDEDLKTLGRIHTAEEGIQCVLDMASIFENVSVDLIYSRPAQKVADWGKELRQATSLPVNHISCYQLIIEENTPLKKMIESGALPRPEEDEAFFDTTTSIMKESGFEMYEVSNFAKNNNYCMHNLGYWQYLDYYGVGPGAHSRVTVDERKAAVEQPSSVDEWQKWALQSLPSENILTEEEAYCERLMMGLRTNGGVSVSQLPKKLLAEYDFAKKVDNLLDSSYIIYGDGNVRLTYEGLKKLNLIVEYLTRR
jgi:oxygen-independent coproporphyrinogen-3 oxidase